MNSPDAAFTAADFGNFTPAPVDRLDHPVFNMPTTPRIDGADAEVGQFTMENVLRAAAVTVPWLLCPGGTESIFGLAEVPEHLADAEQAVREWLAGEPVSDISVTVHDFPFLRVSRRQLRQGDCTGRAFLIAEPGSTPPRWTSSPR